MITQEQVKKLFTYNPKTGYLIWLEDRGPNKVKGNPAGSKSLTRRYITLRIDGKSQQVHRLIFLYHHGFLPKFVDHIDNNQKNNKIENLRGCTHSQNICNSRIRSNNTSGIKGVSWDKGRKKWIGHLSLLGRSYYIGRFKTKSEAEKAIKIKRESVHKEFCNHGY